jgi:hypothetical protein
VYWGRTPRKDSGLPPPPNPFLDVKKGSLSTPHGLKIVDDLSAILVVWME